MKCAKLPKMLEIEKAHGQPIEALICEWLPLHGLVNTGKKLGDYPGGKPVDKQTLANWMTRLGMRQVTVVLAPGDAYDVRRAPTGAGRTT